jgi:hypothetical protein
VEIYYYLNFSKEIYSKVPIVVGPSAVLIYGYLSFEKSWK